MAHTKQQFQTHDGFAIPLQPNNDLGGDADRGERRRPTRAVAVVGTISEAREVAESDLRGRLRRLELGEEAGLCPTLYKLWARGADGSYRLACEIAAIL